MKPIHAYILLFIAASSSVPLHAARSEVAVAPVAHAPLSELCLAYPEEMDIGVGLFRNRRHWVNLRRICLDALRDHETESVYGQVHAACQSPINYLLADQGYSKDYGGRLPVKDQGMPFRCFTKTLELIDDAKVRGIHNNCIEFQRSIGTSGWEPSLACFDHFYRFTEI
jgi:hypothetical protein